MWDHWAAAEPLAGARSTAAPIWTDWEGEVLVVHVGGHLGAATARQVDAALAAYPNWSCAVIDLEGVPSVDRSGAGAVLAAAARARQWDGQIAVAAFEPGAVQVLLGQGVGLVAPVVATVTDAVRLLRCPPVGASRAARAASTPTV